MIIIINRLIFFFLVSNVVQSLILDHLYVYPIIIVENNTHKSIEIPIALNTTLNIFVDSYSLHFIRNVQILDNKCLFSGNVVIDYKSVGKALLSMCEDNNQMTAILEMGSQTYTLTSELTNNLTENDLGRMRGKRSLERHKIDMIHKLSDYEGICGNTYIPEVNVIPDMRTVPDIPNINFGLGIVKLSVSIDEMLFRHRLKGDLSKAKEFVVLHIGYLQKQLRQTNLKQLISLEIVIVNFSIAPFYKTNHWDTNRYLRHFCDWSTSNYTADVHIMLSGSNLWWKKGGAISTQILGLAWTGRLCASVSNCLIIEADNDFRSLHTLVHEFGHTLGAHHDGEHKYGTADCKPTDFIMSWAIGTGRTTWSECTIRQFRSFLIRLDRSEQRIVCLTKEVQPMAKDLDINNTRARYPGLYINVNKQCAQRFGQKYRHYSDSDNVCLGLKCINRWFVFSSFAALEGTECGPNRICERDVCRRVSSFD